MIKKFALLLAASALVFSQFTAAFAQETTETPPEIANMKSEGFTITPADPNTVNPRAFMFEVMPGSEAQDSVLVQNLANEPGTFYLYGADPTFSAQGTPAYKTRQAGGDGEGNWITFEQQEITLGPGEGRELFFIIAVPEGTELGDYRAGIAMEKTKKDAGNPNITIATRVILHMNIKVTDNPQPVPKQSGAVTETDGGSSPWQIYYFWISLGLFIASFIALIWITFQERKEKQAAVKSAAQKTAPKKKPVKKRPSRKKPAAKKRKK